MSAAEVRELFRRGITSNDPAAMREGVEQVLGLTDGVRAVCGGGVPRAAPRLRDGDAAVPGAHSWP